MTDKEQIIIDGKKEKVNILFECNHIDDLQAYEMVKNRIEITPENAPICNFKIKIVSNTKSPYGFYTIFQKDPKKDEWEYMGIGNSGASSLITALLKAHKMGLKRISDLEERVIKHSAVVEEYCNRLADKEQECEELKTQISKIKEYVRHNMFDADCENWFEIFIYTFEDWKKSILENENKYKKECEKYKQALDDILEFIDREDWSILEHVDKGIKDIINKAKDGKNEKIHL